MVLVAIAAEISLKPPRVQVMDLAESPFVVMSVACSEELWAERFDHQLIGPAVFFESRQH